MARKRAKRTPIQDMIADVMNAKQSIANGNEAMDRVEANAEDGCPGWLEAAEYCILLYPEAVFLIEDVKEWAYAVGLKKPRKHQAWSGPTRRLIDAGILVHAGQGRRKYKNHHGDLTNQWRKELTGYEHQGGPLDLPPHGLNGVPDQDKSITGLPIPDDFPNGYDPY